MLYLWGGIAAYFFLLWFAVDDLGTALIGSGLFVLIGLKITYVLLKDRSLARQFQQDRTPDPVPQLGYPANRNCPPER